MRAAAATAALLGLACVPHVRPDANPSRAAGDAADLTCRSGLRVIFEPTPASNVASVMLIVDAGSNEDPVGREGLAHLVEHLSYRVSDAHQISAQVGLHALGVAEDGTTGNDAVLFHESGPVSSLGAMVEAEAARLDDPIGGLDEATFQVERNVVRNELRQTGETDVAGAISILNQRALFAPPHPYSRPVIGTHASLAAIWLPEVRLWTAAHYRPERAMLVITGVADPDVESFVTARLPPALCGGLGPSRPAPRRTAPGDPVGQTHEPTPLVRHRADVRVPELWVSWRLPGYLDGSRFVGDVWASLLGDNLKVSGLGDPDVSAVNCDEDMGLLGSSIDCRLKLVAAAHPEATAQRFLDALSHMNADLPQLYRRAMGRLEISQAYLDETPWTTVQERAVTAHFRGDLDSRQQWAAAQKAVTLDDVRRFQQTYLGPRLAHRTLFEGPAPPGTSTPAAPSDADKVVPALQWLIPAKSALPELVKVRFLTGLQTTTLPNGLQIVTVTRRRAGVVTAALVFRVAVGDAAASLAAADAVKTALDALPADSRLDVGHWFRDDTAGVSAFGNAGALEAELALLSRAVREYRVDWPAAQFVAETVPRLREYEASPSAQNTRLFLSSVLGNHPLAHQVSAAEIAGLSKSRVVDFLDRTVAPRNGLLVVVGDAEPARALAAARRVFSDWRSATAFDVGPPAPALPGPAAAAPAAWPAAPRIVARPGATQAEIIQGCLLPPNDASIDARYDVAASRVAVALEALLRERAGATYGVQAIADSMNGGTAYLRIDTAVGNDELRLALEVLRVFWNDVRSGSWSSGSVLSQQIARVRNRIFDLEHSLNLVAHIAVDWSMRWPLTTQDDYASYVQAASPHEVDVLMRHCADHLVVTIAGDASAIAAASPR